MRKVCSKVCVFDELQTFGCRCPMCAKPNHLTKQTKVPKTVSSRTRRFGCFVKSNRDVNKKDGLRMCCKCQKKSKKRNKPIYAAMCQFAAIEGANKKVLLDPSCTYLK